ncbi:LIM domain-containing protein WLIM1 [Camellia lanceoleosa]|uniref:LIM domain-containing protein WLIM1 n=1 Tax=Camellia lanceoleosa TaxID=1840588 RepID=A0ACC0FR67_9ERIC|nr:LIM domain-containing protein WLIM1 [Camellia lanceoleosa]
MTSKIVSCSNIRQYLLNLQLSNFNSFEGVLYCKPHFDQLFKRTGSLDKSFEGTPKILKPERQIDSENANKVLNAFAGTRDKCVGCSMTVYPIEKVSVNGSAYHRSCFKCSYGGCTISPSNYIAHEGKLYCKHHHIQLFREKGNYSQLEGDLEKESTPDSMEIAAESRSSTIEQILLILSLLFVFSQHQCCCCSVLRKLSLPSP